MGKNFNGTVKPPRRNRLAEDLDKGTAAAPQEAAQPEPAPEKTQPAPAALTDKKKAEAEDREARLAEGRTQGKKGLYAKRINMAFRPDVYEYIRVAAYSDGKTLTEFVNESLLYLMQHDPEYLELRAIKERREARLKANDQE